MEEHETLYAVLKISILWIVTILAHNYDNVAHAILVTLSIAYIGYKFIRDYKRDRKLKR